MKKKLVIITSCFLMLLTTACGSNPKLENGEEVIASVDGKEITADELYNDLKSSYGYDSLLNMIDLYIAEKEIDVYTPLIDLITTRYEEQLYTIFTTNLTPAQLEEKYGKRIVDRLNEMVEKVVFENESYRR